MTHRVEKLVVLFAHICGSVAFYESLGDDKARQLESQCIDVMRRQIAVHRGTLIKTIGDEIMCTFPTPTDAFNAACAMQQSVKDNKIDGRQMYIRIGFHFGEAILEGGDIFGDTVNIAARVASITRAGQIMTTLSVGDELPAELQERTRHIMRTELKGKQEQIDIYLVVWEQEDVDSTRIMAPIGQKIPGANAILTLQYKDKSVMLNKLCRGVVLGRGDECDLVVPNTLASRQHVRIEWRGGKFVITDQSTNGTYIHPDGGVVVQITREEMILHGKGTISLGQAFSDEPIELVVYSIDYAPKK